MLLEGVLVVGEDVTVEVLKVSGLADAQELVVNEAAINGVEFVDVDVVLGVFLHKILRESVCTGGMPSPTIRKKHRYTDIPKKY